MTFRLGFVLFFLSQIIFAQQNEEFKMVKDHFERQKVLLTNEFKKRNETLSADEKLELKEQFVEFMVKLDSVQNATYVRALIKVKNDEDLKKLNTQSNVDLSKQPSTSTLEKTPEYPGGINTLRSQVAEEFYFDSSADEKILKTNITFIVEREGNISNVNAEGDNPNFNRQAIIAVYLLPEKFKPATINGTPVRYMYRLPLTMNFE